MMLSSVEMELALLTRIDRDKVKGYGKLRVVGTLEGKELEIYGNLSVNGHL